MEAHNKNLGFRFPGYDMCRFPKATRSSRGRGDGIKKSNDSTDNDLPKDMHFFELLATVAGQLLQEQQDEPPQENAKTVTNKNVECIETSPCPLVTGQKGSQNASSDPAINPYECIKVTHDSGFTLPNPEVMHDQYSAISGLDHLDLSMPYEFECNTTMTYSSRRRNSEASSCDRKCSVNIAPFEMLIKPETRETTLTRKHVQISTTSPCVHPFGSNKAEVNKHMMNTTAEHHKDINLILQNSFHNVVDAESPPLLSSGSSEETPCLMDPKYDSITAVESKRQDLEIHNFLCEKSSDLKYPITELSNTSFKSPKARSEKSETKQQDPETSGKRKRRRIEGNNDEKEGNPRSSRARAGRKAVTVAELNGEQSSSHNMIVDHVGNNNMLASPTKTEQEKPDSYMTISSPRKSTIKKSGDHVQFSIQSFMIPELSVDLPKSATIANLKKAVMDAAMNLLGGGLCVRVLLQGEKVADESESLLQAGISNGGKLGFMLEPNSTSATSSMEDTFLVLSHGNNQASLRHPPLPQGNEVNTGPLHMGTSGDLLEIKTQKSPGEDQIQPTSGNSNKQDILMHDANGMLMPSSSCALILHPSQAKNGLNGLAVVPFGQNAVNKRRIRRPFSVTEVESLVQAVEELGTGRWRDVKLHAFPQAKHRTYVDLKDKWKTLVHTASIAPHQRRGETVPQALLDRVIQAHSHWTAQQSKQQSPEETKVVV